MKDQNKQQGESKLPFSDTKSFIETQFPVAKVSMESYKERTAKQGQTLTGLGKWWGRKPLVLVRAALLGLLMPASEDPKKDEEIFLRIMTMDTEGLWLRKSKNIPGKRLITELLSMSPGIKNRYLEFTTRKEPKLKKLDRTEKNNLQKLIFRRLSYDEKLKYCDRPEQIEGPSVNSWKEINSHLGTNANSLHELINQLGVMRFGKNPRVGDAFCGGGSIPFEAARLGCDVYGADLNPVAALLTWASLNIVGSTTDNIKAVRAAQNRIYKTVEKKINDWGIERNSLGWKADYYLYCMEVIDPETGWLVPLLPNLVIGQKTNTIAKLIPDDENKCYEIDIIEGVSDEELKNAKELGTIRNSRVSHPRSNNTVPINVIRKDMRLWEKSDLHPLPGDVFQERLYCIRWREEVHESNGKITEIKHYRSPTNQDIQRENLVIEILKERIDIWWEKGYIPKRKIVAGYNTDQPIRERGWTFWHHLFTPRQLLMIGLFSSELETIKNITALKVGVLLNIGRCANWNSKLCVWNTDAANEKTEQTFLNQALNTLYNFGNRTMQSISTTWFGNIKDYEIHGNSVVAACDARTTTEESDIWITDPPYADAVNYEEISELFLAWYEGWLERIFPGWYVDSKRALAIKGTETSFYKSMVDCYQQLTHHMPENGYQLVMFTHQDAAVWADLSMILWAAGLRVIAAWTIATETKAGIKKGNYVQGTVLLVLRKRVETEPVFLDELNHRIEEEVRYQLDSMMRLDDDSDPNFGDADYQLAAYAAALRILTERPIYEIDPEKDVLRENTNGETNPVEQIIRNAVRIACDHLVPKGFDGALWKGLSPLERFYLKGIEVESHGEYRNGVYQELARGFGAVDYTNMLSNTKANETRLKKPSEFGRKNISGEGFSGSLLRTCLFAIYQVDKEDEVNSGLNWFHTELPDYWTVREKIIKILKYLAMIGNIKGMEHWKGEAQAASLLAGAIRNDHV